MELWITDRFKNRKVQYFNDFKIDLVYDSIASTFAFQALFDPDNEAHREIFCVSHYHEAELWHNGELILTGFILSQKFRQSPTEEMASISGYSKTGVFEDCEIPPSLYPLQSNNLSLREIANRIANKFKIKVVVDDAVASKMNKVFPDTTASESENIKSYLHEMAKQKDIVITHTPKGELLFTEAKTKQEPILDFDLTKGTPHGTSFDLVFDGQGMHSDITLQKQASSTGGNAGKYTIENPYVPIVYRPTVKSQTSGDDNDTGLAARRELANELKNFKLTITLDDWIIKGKIIRPNNTVTIYAPKLFMFKKVTWFIESVSLVGNQESTTATLQCVLPEVYTNQVPVSIYKGMNLVPKLHI